ncbi:MAG: hypothetical protein ACFE9N_06160 [Promethearchaeota archaeon]
MTKKGKYKLLSYLVENQLIYYKSLTRNGKIIAFALLQSLNFESIETFLNDFLINRIIQYYAIQIDTAEKGKIILLLNFEEYKKEGIIKAFNLIKQNLGESQIKTNFLKNQILEKKFLANLSQSINFNTSITKYSDSILISADKNSKILHFFSIDLNLLEKKKSFIFNFSNLIASLGKKGCLIFNFILDCNGNIKFSPYFVLESEINEKSFDIESIINEFFHCNLVKREGIEVQKIFNYVWRLGIKDTCFYLKDYYELFNATQLASSSDFLEINELFENNLIENQIEYMRLNKNILFIEQSSIFLILENLNSDYIHRIIEKYYPKYSIYILILGDAGYKEIQEIEYANLIENIKIINPKEIKNFNYEEFKRTGN